MTSLAQFDYQIYPYFQTMQCQFCWVRALLLFNGKIISLPIPPPKGGLGFETRPLNHVTRVSIFCCRDPRSTLRFLGVQRKVTAISPLLLAQQSAWCPRRFELSSALSCMGTRARGQMQYFPEYFCQNPGLYKQNTVESQQALF